MRVSANASSIRIGFHLYILQIVPMPVAEMDSVPGPEFLNVLVRSQYDSLVVWDKYEISLLQKDISGTYVPSAQLRAGEGGSLG